MRFFAILFLAALTVAPISTNAGEGGGYTVAVYRGGARICALDERGKKPVTVKCCETATQQIVLKYRYIRLKTTSIADMQTEVSCEPASLKGQKITRR